MNCWIFRDENMPRISLTTKGTQNIIIKRSLSPCGTIPEKRKPIDLAGTVPFSKNAFRAKAGAREREKKDCKAWR